MAPSPPAESVVALRSLPRRYRGPFAGRGDDESPDDLAHRVGAGGQSAFDHIAAASRSLTTQDRAMEQVLVDDSPTPDPESQDTHERTAEPQPGVSVDARLSARAIDAPRLADRAPPLAPNKQARRGRRR